STELAEAQALADRFTDQLLATMELAPVIRDMYVDRFMERHIAACQRAQSRNSAAPYAPSFGLFMDYKRELLTQASARDWNRFYVAAHNVTFLLFVCALKAISSNRVPEDESALLPNSVWPLIDASPLLSEHFHGPGSASLSSVKDIR